MNVVPLEFPTVAANWEHFDRVDIAADAPRIQRDEMKRAFMAGVSSGLMLTIAAYANNGAPGNLEVAGALSKINAELLAWATLYRAQKT